MKPLKLFEGLSPGEKRVLTSACAILLLLIVFVNLYDFSSFGGGANEIGEIQNLTNNTRVKSKQRVLWEDAKQKQSIHLGDKIFTGKKSTATVKLGRQGSFSLGENSLVEFQMNNKEKLANFKNGSYRLFSNGKLKIAINGKVAEIDADDSEFELVINGTNNIQIKTIKGSGQIKINNKVTALAAGQSESLAIERMTDKQQTVAKIEHFTTTYTPKLYDEYTRDGGVLKKRTNTPVVKHSVRLPIPVTKFSEAVAVEHSHQSSFATKYDYRIFGFNKKIGQAFLGQNYWRYKQENDPWSDAHTFDVVREFPAHSKAELHLESTQLFLTGDFVEARLKIATPQENMGYIVETSRSGDFSPSQLTWQSDKHVSFKISQVGTYFVRARSVNNEYQLGEWSEAQSLAVARPPELKPIELKLSSHSIRVGESIFARWEPQSTIKNYRFHVHKGTQKVLSVPLRATSSDWFPKVPGTFRLSVSATDDFGRQVSSTTEEVQVAEPFILTKTDLPRKPAQELNLAQEKNPVDVSTAMDMTPQARNHYYTHSFLTISTSHFSLQSKPLNDATTDFAQSAAFSVDYLYWLNNHGFQAILQKTLVPLSSGAAVSDILMAEGRYRYRLFPRNGTRFFDSFQLAAFLGYEYYRNSKDTYFLSAYNFMKAGMAVDIPMFQRFVLSGIGAYGTQSGAMKYEMGWDFTYFLQTRMGIGMGYKLHFVEFDLTSEFPGYAPYREAYAQGSVNFKYFF